MRQGIALGCAVLSIAVGAARAEPGVSADAIVFGQPAIAQGLASPLATGMKAGIEAAFHDANRNGGVHGRKLILLGADPARQETDATPLDEQKIFAAIGVAAAPVAGKVPFIGTVVGVQRSPAADTVVDMRAGLDAEADTWLSYLKDELKIENIGVFYQDDAFGHAGLAVLQKAMDRRGLKIAAEGSYERDTVAIKTALLSLRKAAPEAVLMLGAHRPSAEFIRLARSIDFSPMFVNVSLVGASALSKALGDDGRGVIVSQVVPFPWDASVKAVADYQAALKALDAKAEPDFASLEGYLAARLAIAALEKAGPQPTRAGLLQAVRGGGFDLGGVRMSFGDGRKGLDKVYLTELRPEGQFKAIETSGGDAAK